MDFQPGQNAGLTSANPIFTVAAQVTTHGLELDASAFSLMENGKVVDDTGMTFYGQPVSVDGSIRLDPNTRRFDLDLARVPANIHKIALCLTIDQGNRRGQSFGMIAGVELEIGDGTQAHRFAPPVSGMTETALILGEVYRRNGQWKFRAVGQGFNGGLGPLAKHFGVDISDDPDAGATPPAQAQAPAPAPAPGPSVNLSKITLEKRQPVNLNKNDGKFGKIIVNLNWDTGRKQGFMGMLGGPGIDLDLGCMFEHRNGFKGVIQALGNAFGDFDTQPYCKLLGDDRTGSSTAGEFLHINGDRWAEFQRVLIFAFIYQGVPSWDKADARVSIKLPNQPELIANVDSPNNRDGMCAIAMLENDGGAIRASKLVEYFAGHPDMDQAFGFGFRWKAGQK